ncbi:MAG: LysR family transcriptional regulator [Pseudomonadota bacterium]
MRLRHIDIFHAVMVTGSVSAAARLLNMTQPAATRLLQHAEQQLGFPLFERVRQQLLPTEEAKILFPEVQAAYQHVERFERLARRMRQEAGGQLSILATTVLAHRVLPDILKLLNQGHPAAQIEIGTSHSNVIYQDVVERRADVGLVFAPAFVPEGLEVIPLSKSSLCCVYPAEWKDIKDQLSELFKRPLIGIQEDDPWANILECWLQSHHMEKVQPLLLAHNRPLVLKMIERGIGWSILDQRNIEHYVECNEAIRCMVIEDLAPIEVVLLVAKRRVKNPVLDAFIKYCKLVET